MSISPKISLIPLLLLGACTLYAGEDIDSEAPYEQDASLWYGDASNPSEDGGIQVDASWPWIEDGGIQVDASWPWIEDGGIQVDASFPSEDAGIPWPEDGGFPSEDAGIPWPEDGGFPPEDAGIPWPEDAGFPSEDAGVPEDGGGTSCAAIVSEGICVVSGCDPLYSGVKCVCDANGCQCEQWVFDSCE